MTEEYVVCKVEKWSKEIKKLACIAQTQPHAAYSAYTHGLLSSWSFLSRTIPDIADLLKPLEETIHQHLIPALTGRPPCSREERDLLALPVRLGGMGMTNPVSTSHRNFEASTRLTSPLVATIATQDQWTYHKYWKQRPPYDNLIANIRRNKPSLFMATSLHN